MDMKAVEKELKKGLEATSQLRELLLINEGMNKLEKSIEFDNEKVMKFRENCCSSILKSFDTCLSLLTTTSMEVSNDTTHHVNSLNKDHAPDIHPLPNFGQFKSSRSRVKMIEATNLASDGYLWRKYGRKSIQHAQHPREYYRCAFRDDQNCKATKHVQMISNNPTKYIINYFCDHTCNPNLHSKNAFEIQNVSDYIDKDCTNIISFELKNSTHVPKQVPNKLVVHVHDSPPSFGEGGMSSKATLTHQGEDPSTSTFVESTKIKEEPSLSVDIIDALKQRDVFYSSSLSPTMLMSPNYMGTSFMQVEDYSTLRVSDGQYYNFDGVFEPPYIPLWE